MSLKCHAIHTPSSAHLMGITVVQTSMEIIYSSMFHDIMHAHDLPLTISTPYNHFALIQSEDNNTEHPRCYAAACSHKLYWFASPASCCLCIQLNVFKRFFKCCVFQAQPARVVSFKDVSLKLLQICSRPSHEPSHAAKLQHSF